MDLAPVFDRVMNSVRRDRVDPVREYRAIVTWCAGRRPHPDWQELAELPVDTDIQALDDWLVDLLENEPPPGEITGYWFGLYNPVTDDDLPSADLSAEGPQGFGAAPSAGVASPEPGRPRRPGA